MSGLLKQYESVVESDEQAGNQSIAEGDWAAYVKAIANCRGDILTQQARDDVISRKRACALAYLGRRAQKNGGVCSRSQPRIFTVQTIAELGIANADMRFKRYPWLEKLLKLMADIESIQDEISIQGNVISLTGNSNAFQGSSARHAMPPVSVKTPAFSFDAPSCA